MLVEVNVRTGGGPSRALVDARKRYHAAKAAYLYTPNQ
jgi:hypothetical protein